MPKIKIDSERCKGCMLCVLNCPKKSIKASDKINKKGFNYVVFSGDCTGCNFCFLVCPDNAIKVEK